MNRSAGAAARLSESEHLGVRALAGSDTISALAEQLDVSRKFVYGQAHKADLALDNVFSPAAPDDEVLFHLPVTGTWLRQATLEMKAPPSKLRGQWFFETRVGEIELAFSNAMHQLEAGDRDGCVPEVDHGIRFLRTNRTALPYCDKAKLSAGCILLFIFCATLALY
jgi:hypothetical protein